MKPGTAVAIGTTLFVASIVLWPLALYRAHRRRKAKTERWSDKLVRETGTAFDAEWRMTG